MQVRGCESSPECAQGVAPRRSHTDAIEKHVAEMACICNLQACTPRLWVIHESHLASDITLLYQMYYHLGVIWSTSVNLSMNSGGL